MEHSGGYGGIVSPLRRSVLTIQPQETFILLFSTVLHFVCVLYCIVLQECE